jgi:hypothetical protein
MNGALTAGVADILASLKRAKITHCHRARIPKECMGRGHGDTDGGVGA